ncbi:unnamed protein product, partial [Amoebophrya sp. A120]
QWADLVNGPARELYGRTSRASDLKEALPVPMRDLVEIVSRVQKSLAALVMFDMQEMLLKGGGWPLKEVAEMTCSSSSGEAASEGAGDVLEEGENPATTAYGGTSALYSNYYPRKSDHNINASTAEQEQHEQPGQSDQNIQHLEVEVQVDQHDETK